MKTWILVLALIGLFNQSTEAQSLEKNKGAGAILGEPTGISLAYRTSATRTFSAGAAWYLSGNSTMHLHLDYLFQKFDIVDVSQGSLPLYYGLGGRIRLGNDEKVGIRIPLGVAYHFENDPIEIFIEIVPVLDLIPDTDFTGNSGIGARYYF